MVAQIIFVFLAGDLFQYKHEQVVVGIAIARFGAGLELQGQTSDLGDELLDRMRTEGESVEVLKSIDIRNP